MASNSVMWKDIIGYEGLYQVSTAGDVRSLARMVHGSSHGVSTLRLSPAKVLKPRKMGRDRGYMSVTLSKGGKLKQMLVHRLVAEAFIPNPLDLPEVNHKDENGLNNIVENLEWVSPKQNANYGTRNVRIGRNRKMRCANAK